jgi:hypothetical protein
MCGRVPIAHSGALVIHPGPGFPGLASTRLLRGFAERGSRGSGAGWARCWVLRKQACCLGPRYGPDYPVTRMRFRVLVSVRFLRTAQWTRASPVFCRIVVHSAFLLCCQVFRGTRWMPWHQEPMKDAGACDMPRGAGSQAVIRGFPNGETWHPSWGVAAA